MKKKITLLSDSTINQIAAGEVVENPASVVKELIENSLDAGASSITIDIEVGGFALIRIADDGEGMSREDVLLCVQRHATSKIASADDLHHLESMGFRGEALASIAAIAHVTIATSNGEEQTLFDIEKGHTGSTARARGTTIEVRSLFYNVPARKKFQKSPKASRNQITKVVTSLALAHPDIAFMLTYDGTRALSLRATDRKGRIEELLGKEFVSLECPYGFIGQPTAARASRGGQHLFINKRPVVSLPLSFAASEGYGTRLMPQKHPIFVLFLEIPPEEVDVNVHPQKREVRLQYEQRVRDELRRAVAASFVHKAPAVRPEIFATPLPSWPTHAPTLKDEPIWEERLLPVEGRAVPIALTDAYLFVDGRSLSIDPSWEGLVIVDLVAAHARVAYEAVMSGASQSLLVPKTLELSEIDESRFEVLRELGVGIRLFGEKSCIIDSLPPRIEVEDVERVLEGEASKESLARRLAKRGKSRYTQVEAVALVEELLRSSQPLLSPMGKPTMKPIDKRQIGGLFERAN